ncbi:MAG: hypothetical protein A2V77_16300 [Anaeromyxobacter sp. RBG_16_69_14]|nr:MAG: hypothetical protein A2V77_16300 [Anaeromyxobacter sp. RBG_16_69_14]
MLAVLERGEPGAVYHGSDAAPARRREVVTWVAEQLGIPAPRTETAVPGRDRRILSEWTRRMLEVELRYPSFRARRHYSASASRFGSRSRAPPLAGIAAGAAPRRRRR